MQTRRGYPVWDRRIPGSFTPIRQAIIQVVVVAIVTVIPRFNAGRCPAQHLSLSTERLSRRVDRINQCARELGASTMGVVGSAGLKRCLRHGVLSYWLITDAGLLLDQAGAWLCYISQYTVCNDRYYLFSYRMQMEYAMTRLGKRAKEREYAFPCTVLAV
jgi:hypothetical protein